MEYRTDEPPRRTVRDGVEQAHKAAGVPDGLLPPHDGLAIALAPILVDAGVLGQARGLVGGADGEHEEEGQRGPRHEGQELGLRDAVDVVDLQRAAQAELVQERRHELRVRLERDEGGRGGAGVRVYGC